MKEDFFLTDNQGQKVAVQLSIRKYNELLAAWEELSDIKAYRKAKTRKSDPLPFDQAFMEIEQAIR